MPDPSLERGLRPGDRAPFCYGMSSDQRYYSFEDQAGRAAALVLAGMQPPAALDGLMQAFAVRAPAFEALGVDIRVLALVAAPGWPEARIPEGLKLIHCMDLGLYNAAGGRPCVLLLDRATRLVEAFPADAFAVDLALAAAEGLPREPAAVCACPAPVLIRPGLFDADLRRRLIARFEAGPHEAGAVAGVDAEGNQVNRIDAAKKRRRDLVLEASEPLHAEVVQALSARLVPEIRKAFQAEVAHLDRMLIARYDGEDGGCFLRHRDNASAHLAWREFALSVNLNTGEYEGGGLCFPEYNDHHYQPPAGAGLVFSASLLHEATPVTRGSRYVLLTFLHGDQAEAKRVESLAA